jgi:beta-N-acetylhexosaminidase
MANKTCLLISILLYTPLSHAVSPGPASYTVPELLQLTLDEKIAQLFVCAVISDEQANQDFMKGWSKWTPCRLDHENIKRLITEHKIGGVIFYGNNTMAEDQKTFTDQLQALSFYFLLVGLDTETCLQQRLNPAIALRFPCAMALGAIQNKKLHFQAGFEVGKQLKKMGVHIAFSPVADVNYNPVNPIIGTRSFGSDPKHVALCATQFAKGLQAAGRCACGKHFPGHGDTYKDSHEVLPIINQPVDRLQQVELYPFQQLINNGIQAIMLAHLEVPALEPEKGMPSSVSKAIVTDLLQKQMGFKGLIITDAMCMKGATCYLPCGPLEVKALQAGVDIFLCSEDPAHAIACIKKAVQEGTITEQEIDAKVAKILEAKRYALINSRNNDTTKSIGDVLLSKNAQTLQKILYEKSMTYAKKGSEEPFKAANKDQAIIIVGTRKSVFEQTVKQEQHTVYNMPASTNEKQIKSLIKKVADISHAIISIHAMNRLAQENFGINKNTLLLINKLKEHGKKVSVVLFGTPYAIPLVDKADTILVAYEDTGEAHKAAADVVCGKAQAEGILPVDPYQKSCQESVAQHDKNHMGQVLH